MPSAPQSLATAAQAVLWSEIPFKDSCALWPLALISGYNKPMPGLAQFPLSRLEAEAQGLPPFQPETCPWRPAEAPAWASRKGRSWQALAASAWCASHPHSLPCAVWNSQHTAATQHVSREHPGGGGGSVMRSAPHPNLSLHVQVSLEKLLGMFLPHVKYMPVPEPCGPRRGLSDTDTT